MKFSAFDLEITNDLPRSGRWQDAKQLGISCAAVALSDADQTLFWKGVPSMTKQECQNLVFQLEAYVRAGYTLVTWNGCGFDFPVLARESGLTAECGELAYHHVDLMLIVTFSKGWFLSLQKALVGAGFKGKKKAVKLNNGTMLDDMAGEKAPRLWRAGEYEAVLSYLSDDVVELVRLAEHVSARKEIRWISGSGKPSSVSVPKLWTVKECFNIPEPDTSWMQEPPTRHQFVDWIPTSVLGR